MVTKDNKSKKEIKILLFTVEIIKELQQLIHKKGKPSGARNNDIITV